MHSSLALILVIACVLLVFYYTTNSWLLKREAEKFLLDIEKTKLKPKIYSFEILFDSTGFTVASLKTPAEKLNRIEWEKIRHVIAFKRDFFNIDCICLLFTLSDETSVELDEDMKGWLELMEAIPNYLSGCKPLDKWFFDVAVPAFATNPIEIYSSQPNGANISHP
jgi:hypothetical protein